MIHSRISQPTRQSAKLIFTIGLEIRKLILNFSSFFLIFHNFSQLLKIRLFFRWSILFSHPADFTPVCTTELARVVQLYPEFQKRNVKPIALSIDSVESHTKWISDIKAFANINQSTEFPYPIIDDSSRSLAVKFNMLDKDEVNSDGIVLTCRAVFVIDPKHKLRLSILYPASSGRNFE